MTSRPRLLRGKAAEGQWQSPGRVNLIGEFTDFNMGLVLPFAITRRLELLVARLDTPEVVVSSSKKNDVVVTSLSELRPSNSFTWASYVLGTVWAFQHAGIEVPGLEFSFHSGIPLGAGLSSSAAIEAAVAVALNDITEANLDPVELARLCHKAETQYVGAPVGMMDPLAVLNAKSEHAMMIDCLDESIRQVPFGQNQILVIDTRVHHVNRDGGYAFKRSQCERAAARLGVSSLREADLSMVESILEGELKKVAQHVVTENERVAETERRLLTGQSIGDLLIASHRSLQHLFGVSCPELDCIVDTALTNGAEGARMFGAGNGGCALVVSDDCQMTVAKVEAEFHSRGYRRPRSFVVSLAGGAGRVH